MLMSGCTGFLDDSPAETINDQEDSNDDNQPVTDNIPVLQHQDKTVTYGELVILSGSVIDENPSQNKIYLALIPNDELSSPFAVPFFYPDANGNWDVAVSIDEPGMWEVQGFVVDDSGQKSETVLANLTIDVPVEDPVIIQIGVYPEVEKGEIVILTGMLEHDNLDTCTIVYKIEDSLWINGQLNQPVLGNEGGFSVVIGEIYDNLSGVLEVTCGYWTVTMSSQPYNLILKGADDADDDGIPDSLDMCPDGSSDWLSTSMTDYDADGCKDSNEDTDDDNDGILDINDECPTGLIGWSSSGTSGSEFSDYDGDGCVDLFEDSDDDGDGVEDQLDSCPVGYTGWISDTNTDRDGDGCWDLYEDQDDDGDGLDDGIDSCPLGDIYWISNNQTDWDSDGCRDSTEDDDDDNDGVYDSSDECEKTIIGSTVNSRGCADYQNDEDEDGVVDSQDICPDTPLEFANYVNGVGCADRDGDGIWYNEDLCHNTPFEFISNVNSFGCADRDGDGIFFNNDNCPNSPVRWSIDINGCAVSQKPVTWSTGPYGFNPMDTASSFTISTLGGSWSFQNNWDGEDNYLFFFKYGQSSYNTALWNQDVSDLIELLPDENTHFFFGSFDSSYHNDMLSVQTRVNNYINTLPNEEKIHWQTHIHFIDQQAWSITGGLGDVIGDWLSFYYGIDRFQKWREIGSLYNWARQWTSEPEYRMDYIATEAVMYNSEFMSEIRLEDPAITQVDIFNEDWHNGGWSSGYNSYTNATFPNSNTMEDFNTLEIYSYHACDEHKNRYGIDDDGDGTVDRYGGCHEWDYLQYLNICSEVDNHSTCGNEFVRYITTYGREGKWLTDISPFLFMLLNGDLMEFKYSGANKGSLTIIALLSTWEDDGLRASSGEYLFSGGSFRGEYNNESLYKRSHQMSIPSNMIKSELVSIATGHGFGNDDANCAEFCNHEHRFTLNGFSTQEDHPMAGNTTVASDREGCMKETELGVVANQLGSWPFGRAGWCAGQDVKQWTHDITSWINTNGENNLSYQGLYDGQNYIPQNEGGGTGQRIELVSYVVYYVNVSQLSGGVPGAGTQNMTISTTVQLSGLQSVNVLLCTPGGQIEVDGELTIIANEIHINNGCVVTADAKIWGGTGKGLDGVQRAGNSANSGSGGSGGGHSGSGGDGGTSVNSGGLSYGNGTESGSSGGNTSGANSVATGGKGGGYILLIARLIDIGGQITSDGGSGQTGTGGNGAGEQGAGGGSGGSIFIIANYVTIQQSGTVATSGGIGGDGGNSNSGMLMVVYDGGHGGGGGSGGFVSIQTVVNGLSNSGTTAVSSGSGGSGGAGSGGGVNGLAGTQGAQGNFSISTFAGFN